MSRILKAPYVTIDNNNYFSVDNTLSEKIKSIENTIETEENEEVFGESTELSPAKALEIEQEMLENMQNEILEIAREQADQIIENAKNEAQNIINKANLEMEEKANQIYEESKENGFQEGFAQGTLEAEDLKNEANQILLDAIAEKERIEQELEPELINLIIDISQKVLTEAFKINPEIISLLIKKGLNNIKELANLKIIVSEKNYEFILNNKDEILKIDTNKNNIEIIKDSSFEDDDCIIETEFGTIKCGAKEQFEGIKEALQYILG